ncbi:YcaO-like family protein [Actinomycetes bacterium KLBMP 9797]
MRSIHVNTGREALPYLAGPRQRAAIDDLLSCYSPLMGPTRRAGTYLGSTGPFHIFPGHADFLDLDHYLSRVFGMPSLDTGVQKNLFGGGKGYGLPDMFLSSLGETVERVAGALAMVDSSRYAVTTARDLRRRHLTCLGQDEVWLFAPDQYGQPGFQYEPFTDTTTLTWIRGNRLVAGDEVWVPAQLVDLLHPSHPDEVPIGYSVTGGLSCHVSTEDALFHAITEVLERDAMNLRWYAGVAPERLEVDVTPRLSRTRTLLDELAHLPGAVHTYHHNADFFEVPTLTTVGVSPWLTHYSYAAGGGADTSTERCLLKSLGEYGQSSVTLRFGLMSPDRRVGEAVARIFDMTADADLQKIELFFQLLGYYGHVENHGKLQWYLHGGATIQLSELRGRTDTTGVLGDDHAPAAAKLPHLVRLLHGRGIDPIVFDFTPPGLASLRVVKVYMPEFTMPFLPSRPVLGHPRFAEARRMLGAADAPPPSGVSFVDGLVRDPLPYP